MRYARLIDGIVIETLTPPAGFEISDCLTPAVAAQFEPCPDEVEQNWQKLEDGTFVAPPPLPEPEPLPDPLPPPNPNWESFYSGLLVSTAFAHINAVARTDPAIAVAYADCGFALTRASLGLVNVDAIQAALNNLLGMMSGTNALSQEEQAGLVELQQSSGLEDAITLIFAV